MDWALLAKTLINSSASIHKTVCFTDIIAHRGAPSSPPAVFAPENTLPAFLRAVEIGADAVELDVRLTSDRVPVVFHYFYLDQLTTLSGPIFCKTWDEVRRARFVPPAVKDQRAGQVDDQVRISSLDEVLQALAGRIALEIEIKGPELYAADAAADIIKNHPSALGNLEITSYEPMLLARFPRLLPDEPTDLLIPLSEPWMKADVLAYTALQRGQMAGARAVHLHASQLFDEIVTSIRLGAPASGRTPPRHSVDNSATPHRGGCEVHAWGINDSLALEVAQKLGIERICTDNLQLALNFRNGIK